MATAIIAENKHSTGTTSETPRTPLGCDIVIERLYGVPQDVDECRVLFLCGASAYRTSFRPVNVKGMVDIWETLPYTPKSQRAFQSWNNCKDCQFKIQFRSRREGKTVRQTLGQCDIDMEQYIASGKGEHLFCLPKDVAPFESAVLPYIQITLRPRCPSSLPSPSSGRIRKLQESIVSDFETDISRKWTKKENKALSKMAERRAHYLDNWTKMNFESLETYDIADKRISMETAESVSSFTGIKAVKTPATFVSVSSCVSSVDTSAPIYVRTRNTSTEDAAPGSPSEEKTRKDLEEENRKLRSSIARLQDDLSQTKREATSANARVSVLANELENTRMKLEETTRNPKDKSEPVRRVFTSNEGGGLARQYTAGSDVIETSSKRSVLSQKSSCKGMQRAGSIPAKSEASSTRSLQQPPSAEELEAQKLAIAEKVVLKEEIIAKLEKQVDYQLKQLRQFEAGIDGVETRFEREIQTLKVDQQRKHQMVSQKGQEIVSSIQKAEHGSEQLKKEVQKLASMMQRDIRVLEQDLQKKEQKKCRLSEEKRIIKRKFDDKVQEFEEAEKMIEDLRREVDEEKSLNCELRDHIRHLEEKVIGLNSRLADLTIDARQEAASVPDAEVHQLHERIASLESGLAEYESKNRALMEALNKANERLKETGNNDSLDFVAKENACLKQEISDISEKLVDLEQDNNTLKEEAEQLHTALTLCTSLEEEVTALKKSNQELEGHLTRKKKHIEELQGELKEWKVRMLNESGFDSSVSQETAIQAESLIQAEQRYKELEQVLAAVQAERDALTQERSSTNKIVHSLMKETKSLSASLKKQQQCNATLNAKLEDAKIENATLQGTLYASNGSRSSRIDQYNDDDHQLTAELVNAKIELAEMDGKLIRLKRDHHKSMARNMVLAAKATRLETLLRELKQERVGFIRRKTTKLRLADHI